MTESLLLWLRRGRCTLWPTLLVGLVVANLQFATMIQSGRLDKQVKNMALLGNVHRLMPMRHLFMRVLAAYASLQDIDCWQQRVMLRAVCSRLIPPFANNLLSFTSSSTTQPTTLRSGIDLPLPMGLTAITKWMVDFANLASALQMHDWLTESDAIRAGPEKK